MVIAIDGPAGSGKSTTAKIVAKKLGFIHINTGAMYRGIALKCIEENINSDQKKGVFSYLLHAFYLLLHKQLIIKLQRMPLAS